MKWCECRVMVTGWWLLGWWFFGGEWWRCYALCAIWWFLGGGCRLCYEVVGMKWGFWGLNLGLVMTWRVEHKVVDI